MISFGKSSHDAGTAEAPPPAIPRYLQLARAIHARFTAAEEKERAILREAEALATRKNEVIMRSVNEVVDFCGLLRAAPELCDTLSRKTEDITQRLFSERGSFTVEEESIAVDYKVPFYQVDMHMPEHVRLADADNAYLHISFNPVTFAVMRRESGDGATITKHLLMKQYRLDATGTFIHFQSSDGTPADPISDIITELRAKLGHDFFEATLMPFLEAQTQTVQ